MGFYAQKVFPRLCDLALNRPAITRRRRELLAQASGKILEIGFGTGLNLPCYPEHVRAITVVDPNPGMHQLARQRLQQSGRHVDAHLLRGEQLSFADGTFDCVVSTFTLCSIEHVDQALREVRRVLRPGGRFLFLEHGLSPEPAVQKWQRRLNWLEQLLGDGCRLDRNIKGLVAEVAFTTVEVREFYLEKAPRTHGYLYQGVAIR